MKPDRWAFRYLLNSYANIYAEYEEDYKTKNISASDCIENQDRYLELIINAIYFIFEKEELKYATIWLIEVFNERIKYGGFTSYDGSGCYLDKDGNELEGYINWNNPDDYPKEAVYIAWWNK